MPYIVATSDTLIDAADAVTSISVPAPAGHKVDDLLLAFVQQDGGSGAISISGWTEIGTQSAANGQRTAAFYKLAASTSEVAAFTFGLVEDAGITLVVVRGVNTTTPINGNARANTATTESNPQAPALTTTSANCLVFQYWGYDHIDTKLAPETLAGLNYVTRFTHTGGSCALGWFNQRTAGAVTRYKMRCAVTNEGGTVLTVAVNDNGDGALGPEIIAAPTYWKYFSQLSTVWDGMTWQAPNTLAASSIDGLSLSSVTPTTAIPTTASPSDQSYEKSFTIGNGEVVSGSSLWVGGALAVSPTLDISGKLLAFNLSKPAASIVFGARGALLVLQDSSNNWSAFRVTDVTDLQIESARRYSFVLDPATATPLQSGGTLNLTAIARIGLIWERNVTTATTVRSLGLRHFLIGNTFTLVGGSQAAPLSPAHFKNLAVGWLDNDYFFKVQGSRHASRRRPTTRCGSATVLSPPTPGRTSSSTPGRASVQLTISPALSCRASMSPTASSRWLVRRSWTARLL